MTNRYSLSDYTFVITLPAGGITYGSTTLTGQLKLGGPGNNNNGSFLGDVSVTRKELTWNTSGDYTGSWVHSKNLNRTGTITLNINQVSDDSIRLYMLTNVYENNAAVTEGLAIEIIKDGQSVVKATDCMVTKPADLPIGGTAANLRWEFSCGKVEYNVTTNWDVEAQ